ncbi:adenylate/guanylate cyclase domain-containing protein [Variovorax humicola]|uniref:adenylate/guanylate cyclase domain-containing protein n=1 Tax=Variovorax humicola TaxID=1769758 RepID=UPI003BF506EF
MPTYSKLCSVSAGEPFCTPLSPIEKRPLDLPQALPVLAVGSPPLSPDSSRGAPSSSSCLCRVSARHDGSFSDLGSELTATANNTAGKQPAGAKQEGAFLRHASAMRVMRMTGEARARIAGLGFHQRILTVMFSDLSGSVQLAEQMGPRPYIELMRNLRSIYREVIAFHGGVVARLQGDGLVALFGLEGQSSHAGLNAMTCALELHSTVHRQVYRVDGGAAGTLALHTGLDRGLTYCEVGDIERGRFDLVGRTPNLAARLCSLAEPDEIVATARSIGPATGAYAVAVAEQVSPRGTAFPVEVIRVSTRTACARRELSHFPPPTPSDLASARYSENRYVRH